MLNRNPRSVHALTIKAVQNRLNYNTTYLGSDQLWFPFTTISSNGIVYHDALVGYPTLFDEEWRQWTWNTLEDVNVTTPKPLTELGITPYKDGSYADCYSVADSEAHKVIQRFLIT